MISLHLSIHESRIAMSRPTRPVTVAAIQFAHTADRNLNCDNAERLVRDAAANGANIILLSELFSSLYFPIDQVDHSDLAVVDDDADNYVARFQNLAKDLGVVLPVSFYERCNNAFFNTVAVFDADGAKLGKYHKSHIPDGPGYQEKFYFTPGLVFTVMRRRLQKHCAVCVVAETSTTRCQSCWTISVANCESTRTQGESAGHCSLLSMRINQTATGGDSPC